MKFYHDLQNALNELKGYKKLVCGDFNAHGADVLEREDGGVEDEEVGFSDGGGEDDKNRNRHMLEELAFKNKLCARRHV
eukprot:12919635-Prorocentrum_lima.AAC.1